MEEQELPHGFILSESALYAFRCQDIYPDIISFAAAIPNHLKPLFLTPIRVEMASSNIPILATRIAARRYADGAIPTGDTEEAELFGTKTFTYDDNEPTVPSSEPGSIFDIDGADGMTHHQELNLDQNIQVPTETSYMGDVDTTQYQKYPYRTEESPVRHSSINQPHIVIVRLALKPEELEPHTPTNIQENAASCNVQFVSYNKNGRVFTFSTNCGNKPHTVRAALSEIDHVALNCDCPFWRYNGPEFHAKSNQYMFGPQHGNASPPDVRDPDRKYWLCKHAYAVLRRLDSFVQEVTEENWDLDDEELLNAVDKDWDRLEGVVQIPLEKFEEEDPNVEVEGEGEDSEDESPEEEALDLETEDESDDEEELVDSSEPEEEEAAEEEETEPEEEEDTSEEDDEEESEDESEEESESEEDDSEEESESEDDKDDSEEKEAPKK